MFNIYRISSTGRYTSFLYSCLLFRFFAGKSDQKRVQDGREQASAKSCHSFLHLSFADTESFIGIALSTGNNEGQLAACMPSEPPVCRPLMVPESLIALSISTRFSKHHDDSCAWAQESIYATTSRTITLS
jgi:hypothetical protein